MKVSKASKDSHSPDRAARRFYRRGRPKITILGHRRLWKSRLQKAFSPAWTTLNSLIPLLLAFSQSL
jgi:hypothetical protein